MEIFNKLKAKCWNEKISFGNENKGIWFLKVVIISFEGKIKQGCHTSNLSVLKCSLISSKKWQWHWYCFNYYSRACIIRIIDNLSECLNKKHMKVILKISDCKMKHSKLGCKKSLVIFLKLDGNFMLTVAYADISRCLYTGSGAQTMFAN